MLLTISFDKIILYTTLFYYLSDWKHWNPTLIWFKQEKVLNETMKIFTVRNLTSLPKNKIFLLGFTLTFVKATLY